jgi:hypothetical protein
VERNVLEVNQHKVRIVLDGFQLERVKHHVTTVTVQRNVIVLVKMGMRRQSVGNVVPFK